MGASRGCLGCLGPRQRKPTRAGRIEHRVIESHGGSSWVTFLLAFHQHAPTSRACTVLSSAALGILARRRPVQHIQSSRSVCLWYSQTFWKTRKFSREHFMTIIGMCIRTHTHICIHTHVHTDTYTDCEHFLFVSVFVLIKWLKQKKGIFKTKIIIDLQFNSNSKWKDSKHPFFPLSRNPLGQSQRAFSKDEWMMSHWILLSPGEVVTCSHWASHVIFY